MSPEMFVRSISCVKMALCSHKLLQQVLMRRLNTRSDSTRLALLKCGYASEHRATLWYATQNSSTVGYDEMFEMTLCPESRGSM